MANLTVAAGGNGVAGNDALPAAVVTGTLAAGNKTDTTAGNTNAIRHSVSKTRQGFGSSVAVSEVFSESTGFRTAYSGVEADSPTITRTA